MLSAAHLLGGKSIDVSRGKGGHEVPEDGTVAEQVQEGRTDDGTERHQVHDAVRYVQIEWLCGKEVARYTRSCSGQVW